MNKIYSNLYGFLDIGDEFPTIIMGVLNLSPESFYKSSVYDSLNKLEPATLTIIENGALMLDLGARSTAPWSKKITLKEEIKRIIPAMELVCKIIPENIVISVDTQYREVAQKAYKIASNLNKKIIINDISNLKTDPTLEDFIIDKSLPIILMASKKKPGDLCTIEEIIDEFEKTIDRIESKGYDGNNIILDPGIGHWIEKKTYEFDLKIINNLEQLRILEKPILVAISRKSFIGEILNIPNPNDRYNGTISATAIAVYNGVHIIRTHDVNSQLIEILKMARAIRHLD
jgi:dihydropteroate synthase